MAITGDRFLRISKTTFLAISRLALDRLEEFLGAAVSLEEAFVFFREANQLTYAEMLQRGYRPAYRQRKQVGTPSWYFDLRHPANELIAVIAQGEVDGEYEWVTTYAPNCRNESNLLWGIEKVMRAA